MKYLGLILALVQFVNNLTRLLERRRIISEYEAKLALRLMTEAEDEIKRAEKARKAAADKLNADPDSLRDDDGFKRD